MLCRHWYFFELKGMIGELFFRLMNVVYSGRLLRRIW